MDEVEITRAFGNETYRRGKEYFDEGRVINAVKFNDVISAEVFGTQKYETKVRLGNLGSKCSCQVGHNCKHGVAVAIAYVRKRYKDGNSIIKRLDGVGRFQLLKIVEQLIQDDPATALRIQAIMGGVAGTEKNTAHSRTLIESTDRELQTMLNRLEHGDGDSDFVETFSQFVRTYKSQLPKKSIFYALEFLVKNCEDYGSFYDDYADDSFGDPVFESLCDAFALKELGEEDFARLRVIQKEDEYNMLDAFVARLTEPENAKALAKFGEEISRLLQDDRLYADFLINAGKKDEARTIVRDEKRRIDEESRFRLYLRIDKDEATRFAKEEGHYRSLISFYSGEGSDEEAVEMFRRFLRTGLRLERGLQSDFPFEAMFDSLNKGRPKDYAELCHSLFDLCLRAAYRYDLCVDIAIALDDTRLLMVVLEKSKRARYYLISVDSMIKLLKRLSLSDMETSKKELTMLVEKFVDQKKDHSYDDAVKCALVLKEMMAKDEWDKYSHAVVGRHYRKINFLERFKAVGIASPYSQRRR